MPQFSSSDINDAKRRVREMQERAKAFANPQPTESAPPPAQEAAQDDVFSLSSLLGGLTGEDGDTSKALVLALILILSREKADNSLLLALLYILL